MHSSQVACSSAIGFRKPPSRAVSGREASLPSAGGAAMAQTRSSGGLFDPARIGSVDLRNRVIMPAMTTRLADAEGFVTDDSIAYYAARARGGVGLVTVEMAAVERAGRHRKHELGVFHDRYLPGLTRLVGTIHDHGARASIQLGHAGGHTRVDISGETPIAPSPVAHSVHEGTTEIVIPQEMSIARTHDVRDAYVAAAVRAAAAGFDAVEIHAAHGYLLSQFLCPVENLRRDDYGGTVENRSRLISEIVALIKGTVPRLAVIVRISGDELFPEGMPLKDACEVAQYVERAGADAIHVSAGHYRSLPSAAIMTPPMAMPERIFLDLAATIRKAVNVPVIAVGRLGHGKDAEMAVVSGKADFVALGRPLLADQDWVAKSMRGEIPRQCLACNTCVDEMRKGDTLHCLVNPITGREREFAGRESEPRGRRIAVVGAGPAGLSYASLAAAGNAVTVFEKSLRSGGALLLAGQAPVFQGVAANPASLDRYVEALEASCRSSGVRFEFGVDVQRQPGVLGGFDLVVAATGAPYRFGIGPFLRWMTRNGATRWPGLRSLAEAPSVREWLFHRARVADRSPAGWRLDPGTRLIVIGDAEAPGDCVAAIKSAFRAALSPSAGDAFSG